MNFSTFYTQAIKDKAKKIKKGKYRGQSKSLKSDGMQRLPGPAYYAQPGGRSDAPSASTFKTVG
jgi:hypothetical protein